MFSRRDTVRGEVTRLLSSLVAARAEPQNVEGLGVAGAKKEVSEVARTAAVTARDETETALDLLRRDYDHLVLRFHVASTPLKKSLADN